ncbi:MAG: SH3 domain-containing protein [Bacteroidota bacterium]
MQRLLLLPLFLWLLFSMQNSIAQPVAVVRGTNINVRSGAGTNHPQLFQLNTGDSCRIKFNMREENIMGYGINAWYKIDYQGQEGFVFGAFLDFVADKVATNRQNTKSQQLSKIIANEVNARVCASLTCAKAFQVNAGDEVQVIGKTMDYHIPSIGKKPWYEVVYNGQKGFIYSHFVDCTTCDFNALNPVVSTNNSPMTKGTIIGDKVNIRSGSATNYPILFQLDIGAICEVQKEIPVKGQQLPWYKIKANGQTGYVYGEFLSVTSTVQRPVKVWAVVAGISDYANLLNSNYGVTDLRYADTDAKRMYQFLKSPPGGNLPDDQIVLLRNQEATSQNILQNAQRLFQQAGPQDLIIVYFSGHGGPNYFVAYDQALKYSDIKTVVEQSPAKKRLCIADACYSGTWSNNTQKRSVQKRMNDDQLEQLYYDALASSTNGIALFMSSSNTETSLEIPQIGQGLFTYFYIEGLKGAADADKNQIITLKELYEFVQNGVSYVAWTQFQHRQTPKISGYFDTEMPIGIVR